MGILQNFRRVFGQSEMLSLARNQDGWISSAGGTQPSLQGFAALQRGIEVIKGQLISTHLLAYENGKEVADSPVAQAIRNTPQSHFDCAFNDMLWSGNGWLRIHKSNNLPTHFECIQAFRMSAVMTNGVPEYRLDGKAINPKDYLHFMCRNNFSPFVGDSLTETYSQSIASTLATLSIFNQLQGNGSHAEVYLTTDLNLDKVQMDKLRAAYASQTSNQGSSGGVVILSSGLKPMSIKRLPSALDSEIISSMQFSVAEASRMTGVPLQYLGIKDSNAYASAVESGREFFRTTIRPLMSRIQSEMTLKLATRIEFDVGEVSLGYGTERAESLSKLVYSGIINRNEARASMGYGLHPELEEYCMPVNQAPLTRWLNSQPNDKPIVG